MGYLGIDGWTFSEKSGKVQLALSVPGEQSAAGAIAPRLLHGEKRSDRLLHPPTVTRFNHSIRLVMGIIATSSDSRKTSGREEPAQYPLYLKTLDQDIVLV